MTTTITIAFRIFFNKKFQLIRSLHISFYIFNGVYASEAEARVRGEAEARVSRVKSRKLAASPLSLSLSLSLSRSSEAAASTNPLLLPPTHTVFPLPASVPYAPALTSLHLSSSLPQPMFSEISRLDDQHSVLFLDMHAMVSRYSCHGHVAMLKL
jgi:hypothetical protein